MIWPVAVVRSGNRHKVAAMPNERHFCTNRPTWVVLPHRSTPSKTINEPRGIVVEGDDDDGTLGIILVGLVACLLAVPGALWRGGNKEDRVVYDSIQWQEERRVDGLLLGPRQHRERKAKGAGSLSRVFPLGRRSFRALVDIVRRCENQ
eukprot:scaffold117_cov148-Amphora_coffeaeformis.AAC.5